MTLAWDAARLSLFQSLQLIVSTRVTEDAARSLQDFSSFSKIVLVRQDAGGATMGAFEQARRDLENWCKRGLISARGFRIIGHFGQTAHEKSDLSESWSSDVKFDYEKSSVVLSGEAFTKVTLRTADVEKQLAQNAPRVPSLTGPARRRMGAKDEAVRSAIAAIWPKGLPSLLPAKDRNRKIVEWCEKQGVSSISGRTIERALNQPTDRDK